MTHASAVPRKNKQGVGTGSNPVPTTTFYWENEKKAEQDTVQTHSQPRYQRHKAGRRGRMPDFPQTISGLHQRMGICYY